MKAFDLASYGKLIPLRASALTQSFAAMGGGRRVVVKQLRPDLAGEASTREAWLGRAAQAAALGSPRVVEILDYGEHDGSAYLAEAYVEASSLREALATRPAEQRRLPAADVVALARMALEGLRACAAAEPPVLHLNLSPANLLVTTGGEAMLGEPGLWAAIDPREAARLQFDRGEVGYQSPEQIQARSELDARSDLFSLGCILHELLTGERAFSGKSQLLVAMAISRDERRRVTELAPDVPDDVAAIVEALYAHSPDERFGSPSAALNALSVCAASEGLPAGFAPARNEAIWKQVEEAAGGSAAGAGASLPGAKRDGHTTPFLWANAETADAVPVLEGPAPGAPADVDAKAAAPSPGVARPASSPAQSPPGPTQVPPLSQPPRSPGSPVPPPMVAPAGAPARGPVAPPRHESSRPPGGAAPAPPPMVKPPPMVGAASAWPATPAGPSQAAGPAPPPRAPVAAPGSTPPPSVPPLGPGRAAAPPAPVNAPAAAPATAPPSAPPSARPAARPGGAGLGPAPAPASSEIGPSGVPGAAPRQGGPAASATPPAPYQSPPGGPSASPSTPPPLAGSPSGSPARWREPSQTVFDMKARRETVSSASGKGMPLGVKLLLAGMGTFGVVLLAALAFRLLR